MRFRDYQSRASSIWIIIMVNVVLLIATIILGKGIYDIQGASIRLYKAHYYLGLIPAAFLERPWTILTSMFLHAGFENFWHIFANMFTLYFFGTYLSRLVGERKFLLVYFAGGLLGSIFYIILGTPFIPAVGASGAVFAIAGALTVMAPKLRVLLWGIIPMHLWVAVLGGFAILSFMPFVAWQAHLGGLLFGLVAGYFFKKKMRYYFIS